MSSIIQRLEDEALNTAPVKLGPFEVELQFCGMVAGHSLQIKMPDGRVVSLYANAAHPEIAGGNSLLEVYPSFPADPSSPEVRSIGF